MLVDTEVFETAKIVIDQLKQHNATEALRWCAENRSRLKKFDSILEFQLRAQEFIELVKYAATRIDAPLASTKRGGI